MTCLLFVVLTNVSPFFLWCSTSRPSCLWCPRLPPLFTALVAFLSFPFHLMWFYLPTFFAVLKTTLTFADFGPHGSAIVTILSEDPVST